MKRGGRGLGPGATVRLTGKAAWQLGGPTPGRTEWTVVRCNCGLCSTGRFIAVDEDAVRVDPDCTPLRHLAIAAVQGRHHAPTVDQDFPPPEAYSPYAPKVGAHRRRAPPTSKRNGAS